jgi:hypothetical protein
MKVNQGETKFWHLSAVLSAFAAVALMVTPMSAAGQQGMQDQYEYEYDQGLHEEEWYDPSDWFSTKQDIDYEQDWYENTYQYYDEDFEPGYRGYYEGEEFEAFEEDDYDFDYYTDTWFEEDDEFDEWYE